MEELEEMLSRAGISTACSKCLDTGSYFNGHEMVQCTCFKHGKDNKNKEPQAMPV